MYYQDWHPVDEDAQWRASRCPGPDPFFKAGQHPFVGVVARTDDPVRIKPDVVHTFDIGMCRMSVQA